MHVKMLKARRAAAAMKPRTRKDRVNGLVTTIRLTKEVDVGTIDRWLCFWVAGREVRVGPLTTDQAEKLCDDLGYDAVE